MSRLTPPIAEAEGIEPLLKPHDFRDVLNVGQRTFERLKSAGKLPRADLMIGRSPRWKPSTIRAWIEGGGHR